MDDMRVVDDVLGLKADPRVSGIVIQERVRLTVMMKKRVSMASHCLVCSSCSSMSSAPYISLKSPGTVL